MAAFYFTGAGTDNILDNPGWPLHVTKFSGLIRKPWSLNSYTRWIL